MFEMWYHSLCLLLFLAIQCRSLNPFSNYLGREYFENYDSKPHHVHISFGDTIHEINVVWATLTKCKPKVHYGSHPWEVNYLVSEGNYINFKESNENGLQHLYRVKLQKLMPNETYYYIPFCDDSSSGPYYFETPRDGNDWSPDFLMFGDMGIHSYSIPSLLSDVMSGNYSAVFHVGDIAYDLHTESGLVGDYFMDLLEPLASSIPYLTCPGNHEIDNESFAQYRHRFAMPGSDWPIPVYKMWYSFDIGPVHFISYSTEVFFTNDGVFEKPQKQWLLRDLDAANANRLTRPWIIAFGHRPMYCSTRIGDDCSLSYSLVRTGLEEIFFAYDVDIVIQAHEHNYERLWPLYKGQVYDQSYVNPNAPVQIITGAAGSTEGVDPFPNVEPAVWSAFQVANKSLNSYGRMLVANFTHILWEQRSIHNHDTLDSVWIVKERNFSVVPTKVKLRKTDVDFEHSVQRDRNSFLQNHLLAFSIVFGCFCVILAVFITRRFLQYRKKKKNVKLWPRQNVNLEEINVLSNLSSDDDFSE